MLLVRGSSSVLKCLDRSRTTLIYGYLKTAPVDVMDLPVTFDESSTCWHTTSRQGPSRGFSRSVRRPRARRRDLSDFCAFSPC